MDPVFGVDLTPVLQREGRSSAGAQQTFQTRAVGAFDAHAGVGREAATVRPVRHRLGVFRLKHPAAGERAQQTPSMTRQWQCTYGLSSAPKRWMKATAPIRESEPAPGRRGARLRLPNGSSIRGSSRIATHPNPARRAQDDVVAGQCTPKLRPFDLAIEAALACGG